MPKKKGQGQDQSQEDPSDGVTDAKPSSSGWKKKVVFGAILGIGGVAAGVTFANRGGNVSPALRSGNKPSSDTPTQNDNQSYPAPTPYDEQYGSPSMRNFTDAPAVTWIPSKQPSPATNKTDEGDEGDEDIGSEYSPTSAPQLEIPEALQEFAVKSWYEKKGKLCFRMLVSDGDDDGCPVEVTLFSDRPAKVVFEDKSCSDACFATGDKPKHNHPPTRDKDKARRTRAPFKRATAFPTLEPTPDPTQRRTRRPTPPAPKPIRITRPPHSKAPTTDPCPPWLDPSQAKTAIKSSALQEQTVSGKEFEVYVGVDESGRKITQTVMYQNGTITPVGVETLRIICDFPGQNCNAEFSVDMSTFQQRMNFTECPACVWGPDGLPTKRPTPKKKPKPPTPDRNPGGVKTRVSTGFPTPEPTTFAPSKKKKLPTSPPKSTRPPTKKQLATHGPTCKCPYHNDPKPPTGSKPPSVG